MEDEEEVMSEWVEMDDDIKEEIKEMFAGGNLTDLVVRKRDSMVIPRTLLAMLETIKKFEVREDDIFIVSYPKCGTTFTMQLVWLIANNMDVEKAKGSRGTRCGFLEGPAILGSDNWEDYYHDLSQAPSPRVFNTHLRLDMLPQGILNKARVVFVNRNAKDCVVSYYHHNRLLKCHNYKGDFDRFSSLFRAGVLPYGSYWGMFSSFWPATQQMGQDHRIEMVWYEDLKEDLESAIRKLAEFLEYSITQEGIEQVKEFLKVENFKKRCNVGPPRQAWNVGEGEFIRKGIIGDWVNYLGKEKGEEWSQWAEQQIDKIGVKEKRARQISTM